MEEWRDLDRRLVDAQEARRILDRLYGYEVSPVLWKKIMPRLSAGRVQSVATRMIVERERARMKFRSATWWDLDGTFAAQRAAGSLRGQPGGPGGNAGGHRSRLLGDRCPPGQGRGQGAGRSRGHPAGRRSHRPALHREVGDARSPCAARRPRPS